MYSGTTQESFIEDTIFLLNNAPPPAIAMVLSLSDSSVVLAY